MLKIESIYEKQIRTTNERPDGSQYMSFEKVYDARDCLLNPAYVVSVHPHEASSDGEYRKMQDRFPEGTKFTKFVVDGNSFRASEILVVGSFNKFAQMLETK